MDEQSARSQPSTESQPSMAEIYAVSVEKLIELLGTQLSKVKKELSRASKGLRHRLNVQGGYKYGHALNVMFAGGLSMKDSAMLRGVLKKAGLNLEELLDIWKWLELMKEHALTLLRIDELKNALKKARSELETSQDKLAVANDEIADHKSRIHRLEQIVSASRTTVMDRLTLRYAFTPAVATIGWLRETGVLSDYANPSAMVKIEGRLSRNDGNRLDLSVENAVWIQLAALKRAVTLIEGARDRKNSVAVAGEVSFDRGSRHMAKITAVELPSDRLCFEIAIAPTAWEIEEIFKPKPVTEVTTKGNGHDQTPDHVRTRVVGVVVEITAPEGERDSVETGGPQGQ